MERDERDERRYVRKKKRRRRNMKILWKILLATVILGSLAVLIVWKAFTVKEIIVEGNEHYTEKQIRQFVQSDQYSWNSLYVALKYRFFDTDQIPFVESMEVSLKNPHTLKVHVYEKGIVGYLYISAIGQNAYFDTDGFVVETSKKIIKEIPQVEGLDCEKVVLYEKLPIKNESILRCLLTATQALKKYDAVPEKICFDENEDLSLRYKNIEVSLGSFENLSQKLLRLPGILSLMSGKSGTLNLENWTENTNSDIFGVMK